MSRKSKRIKPRTTDEAKKVKLIKGVVVAAHELYMFVEHAIAEAINGGHSIRAQIRVPYKVIMQAEGATGLDYPDAELVANIHIDWDGSLHGVEPDAKSGKIS